MMRPVRLQLSRRKGFDLQAWSRKINGLDAVNCARPGRFGNPFVVGQPVFALSGAPVLDAAEAVEMFRSELMLSLANNDYALDNLLTLRGKNLACWCALGAPCHADVLLEFANKPVCEPA
jgi:hypothetical protein